ncbi:ABC transporter substrate-binding protein [Aquabacter sp. L1I39]|uniref:ABC transporter substrate-binding protein n=1 Tax=Aquabacter sp. L1I39 TaxID=2820278 RepID=UPI001ADC5D7C|nr:ABC transporter substrate-binding protein [Aquabacter sp. L1I39]QTL05320.1 ABC transporter substrate-binding protein [Aquabacter sp. L1I39]
MKKFALPLVSALALAAASPTLAQSINIGHLADYSGGTSDVGKPYGQGVQDTIAWINKNGGVNGKQINSDFNEYGYQVPRALAAFKKWVGTDKVVAIQGWGTADTEALVAMVTKEEIPYYSGSYAATLTDPKGKVNEKSERAAPFNFFYGPSYSDAARAMVQWAADDWKAKGGQGKPKWVHMGANHPFPNSPKAAAEAYAKELGFEVLDPITFALTPGDYTAQCLTLKQSGANYAYLGNTAGSNISVLKACEAAGVKAQFFGNVWGMDENAAKAAGSAANGVIFPVRTAVTWTGSAPGLSTFKAISKMSDPDGKEYRPVHYLAAVCTVMYMKEAMEWADKNGGVTGVKIRDGMYQKKDWVPKGTDGVCNPSTWTATDHRPTTTVDLYRAVVNGSTEGTVTELVDKGVIKLDKVATINLPRKTELQGW